MKTKIAIKYGAICGLFIVSTWFISYLLWGDELPFSGSELIGYAIMLVALTTVFMGIKNKRDSEPATKFTFKDGFFTGLGIIVVASVIYVIGWMVYMPNFAPDFVDNYERSQIELIENSDIPDNEKQTQITEVKSMIENYKKPYIMVAFTFMEIFPIGLLVTLISALILRRKE